MTFRSTVVRGRRLNDWKTNPILSFRSSESSSSSSFATSLPSKRYSPDVGVSSAPRMCMSVDFPDPEGPMMATKSPFPIPKETWSRATVSISPFR